jgi:shikimate dehydrogenase
VAEQASRKGLAPWGRFDTAHRVQTFYPIDALPTLSPPAKLAVIGDPIAHSKSPQMHNPALAACGIDAQYIRVQVPVGTVAGALRTLAAAGYTGINVTIPHKFETLAAMDVVDPRARLLGAVNTVHVVDGKLHGYNSDGPGFVNSVQEAFGVSIKGLRVLILGAGGGAGRAVAVQCALEGCAKLLLVNRTAEKLAPLVAELPPSCAAQAVAWEPAALASVLSEVDLIVNATSLGMQPDDAPLLPAGALTAQHLVFDMVYRAGAATQLGALSADVGARYVDGLTLLLHQGAISFEHWFGVKAPIDRMRTGLAAAVSP